MSKLPFLVMFAAAVVFAYVAGRTVPPPRTPLGEDVAKIVSHECRAASDWLRDAADAEWCDEDDLADAFSERLNMLRKLSVDEIDITVSRRLACVPREMWRGELLALSKEYHERATR